MINRTRRAIAPAAACALALLGAAPLIAAQDAAPKAAGQVADAPAAEKLFQKHLEAIGGREAIEGIKHMHTKGSIEMPAMGMNMSMEMWQAAPDKMRMTMTIPGFGQVEQGYDGETGWMINPMSGGPMLLEGPMLEDMKQQAQLGRDARWKDLYTSMKTVGKEEFNGKSCWAVKVETTGGTEQTLFFDAESGLQQGSRGMQASDMGEVEAVTRHTEWIEKNGIKMVSKMEVSIPAMGMNQTVSFSEVSYEEIPAEKFELPDPIKKLKQARDAAAPAGG